jgi:hypothetical protein
VRAVARTGECHFKVDTGPVLEHVERLRAAGWRLRDIAAAADVGYPTLADIRKGARRGTRSRCWNTTRDRVLALDPLARR